ncbi:uncharacterized protein LOC111298621 isoform X1 [Durio zibethinus]|uniref:Uncharacterized protein LOC111298621 isoform X1 n=1 Tax=Durio zibethinus TaxID=66656 RepID=A0A6P5Z9H6_DURZI|nr:uncharacterized protein LOC111298621 isoform X1 [Durio zibethinus]
MKKIIFKSKGEIANKGEIAHIKKFKKKKKAPLTFDNNFSETEAAPDCRNQSRPAIKPCSFAVVHRENLNPSTFQEKTPTARLPCIYIARLKYPYTSQNITTFFGDHSQQVTQSILRLMAGFGKTGLDFEDLLPVMAEKLGGEGLIRELCNGFNLLMDKDKGVITLESLKMNAASLRLQDLRDEEIVSMIREGDLDGDDALNEMEFCVLMFRLSPGLMEESQLLLEEILEDELNTAGF